MYALKMMIGEGYTPMTVPWMVNDEAMWGAGYFPWGKRITTKLKTAKPHRHRRSFINCLLQRRSFSRKDLPLKMVGISPCYRREVGSYGKDTKGIFEFTSLTRSNKLFTL